MQTSHEKNQCRMFRGIMGCSRGIPGLFLAVPGVFRGVPGVPGSTDTQKQETVSPGSASTLK